MINFKNKPLEERRREIDNILKKYPYKIPIYLEKTKGAKVNTIDKNKFLVPRDMSFAHVLHVFRKRIQMKESEALYVFINNELLSSHLTLSEIYNKYKSEDGMLYAFYNTENTFG